MTRLKKVSEFDSKVLCDMANNFAKLANENAMLADKARRDAAAAVVSVVVTS